MRRNCEKGYTLIEVIAVLSILIMVINGMSKMASNMYGKYKHSTLILQIRDLRKIISDRYAATGNYSTLKPKLLIDEKIAPANMVVGALLVNSFSGKIELGSAATYGANKSFFMRFLNLPRATCVEAASIDWRVDDTSSLVNITVNTKKFDWPINKLGTVTPGVNTLPLTMTSAQTACNDANDKNTITWEFQ